MTDIVDQETRSRMMAGIRGKDTTPELIVRRGLHGAGFRYRLHSRRLPGRPDLVLRRHRALILVNGCFWHGHKCHLFKWPRGPRAEFWRQKIVGNIQRDRQNYKAYEDSGWRVAVVWECALKGRNRLDSERVIDRLAAWIGGSERFIEISGKHTGGDRQAM